MIFVVFLVEADIYAAVAVAPARDIGTLGDIEEDLVLLGRSSTVAVKGAASFGRCLFFVVAPIAVIGEEALFFRDGTIEDAFGGREGPNSIGLIPITSHENREFTTLDEVFRIDDVIGEEFAELAGL